MSGKKYHYFLDDSMLMFILMSGVHKVNNLRLQLENISNKLLVIGKLHQYYNQWLNWIDEELITLFLAFFSKLSSQLEK